MYFNYKGSHSIVLLTWLILSFIYDDVGVIGIPEIKPLPGRQKAVPYVILSDAAFPLSEHILKPYPFRNMTEEQRIFNYRLSRGRRVVENALGTFANRFRGFLTTINLGPEKV